MRSRALFVYRFKQSLIAIMTVKTRKPVLYSMTVKKGSKKIQKTMLYAFRIRERGFMKAC